MAYQKHIWTDDEVITKEKLNNIEDGIENIELTPGPKGEPGKQGTAGENGLGWLFGTNVPNSEGRDGDLYLKTDNFDVYKKVSGSWQKIGNIKGAQGAQGPKGADAVINKLNKVDDLAGGADAATIVTAFNSLIADLKAKGFMNEA